MKNHSQFHFTRLGSCSLLVLLTIFVLDTPMPSRAMPLASITFPSGAIVGNGNDFATAVLRDPWDMNEASDIWEAYNMSNVLFANGKLSFTTGADPAFWLLHQGYGSDLNIGKTGVTYPINADYYRVFSFRMNSQQAGFAYIYWYKDQDVSKFGVTASPITIQPGWHVYTVDLKNIGTKGSLAWNGQVAGLRFDPLDKAGVTIEIDWVRLTPQDTSHVLPITWSGVSGSTLNLYLADNTSACDGPQIASITSPASAGTFNWGAAVGGDLRFPYPLPLAIALGNYYVCGRVGSGSPFYSAGPLTVKGPPILWFTYPSYLTGPDYATNAGVPWNMNPNTAFTNLGGLNSYSFSGGQFHGINSGGDPYLRFNTPVPLDTNKYKYFSIRMYLEGTFDLFGGWVARVFWYSVPEHPSTTDDITIFPGWNTYTVDLTKAALEPGGSPWIADSWKWFRFDPNENIRGVPWTFHIDYALLTGDPTGKIDSQVPIWYELSETSGVTVTLYYDTDTSPGGETPIMVYTPQPATGPYFVYLPTVLRDSSRDLPEPSGILRVWDTTSVPEGRYYIRARVSDGYNTTYWYSDVPFVLTN